MSRVLDLWVGMTGTVLSFAGSTAPAGWLLCHGQAVSRTTYATLFGVIGTAFGGGDGSTTFNLPDLRGRVAAGKDNMGGTAAGRLTNTGTGNPGINGSTLGAAGGADRHSLTTPQLPAHTHSITQNGNDNITPTGGTTNYRPGADTSASGTTGLTGAGESHPNVQPTIVLNSIIKT